MQVTRGGEERSSRCSGNRSVWKGRNLARHEACSLSGHFSRLALRDYGRTVTRCPRTSAGLVQVVSEERAQRTDLTAIRSLASTKRIRGPLF